MTFDVSLTLMAGSDSPEVDTDSSLAPGITYRLQGSMNVQRGTCVSASVTVLRCVFLVFYIRCISKYSI